MAFVVDGLGEAVINDPELGEVRGGRVISDTAIDCGALVLMSGHYLLERYHFVRSFDIWTDILDGIKQDQA